MASLRHFIHDFGALKSLQEVKSVLDQIAHRPQAQRLTTGEPITAMLTEAPGNVA